MGNVIVLSLFVPGVTTGLHARMAHRHALAAAIDDRRAMARVQ
jgi:hypothetical protein